MDLVLDNASSIPIYKGEQSDYTNEERRLYPDACEANNCYFNCV